MCLVICTVAAGNAFAAGETRKPIPASLKKYAAQFVITQSGSYYLAGNRLCDTNGIVVDANNVTIDLRGFTLTGNRKGAGIYMTDKFNVEILNGTITDFNYAVYDQYIYMVSRGASANHRVSEIRATDNTQGGINLCGPNCQVRNCLVSNNGSSASGNIVGIAARNNATITGNTVCDNGANASGSGYIFAITGINNCIITGNAVYSNGYMADVNTIVYGINCYTGSSVSGNTISNNGTAAGSAYGILAAGSGCSVTSNTVYGNGGNSTGTAYGIYADSGSTISGNSAYLNGNGMSGSVDGIYAGAGSTVIGNTVYSNGNSASGTVYGIHLVGNNLVNQNTAYSNGGTNMNDPCNCTFGDNHAPL